MGIGKGSPADYLSSGGKSMSNNSSLFSNLGSATWGDVATAGAFSLLQAGIGYFSDKQAAETQYRNDKRNFKLRVQQARQQTAETNAEIARSNAYAMYEHGIRKQLTQQQMGFNAQAAIDAYVSEQLRANEIAQQYGFNQEAMRSQFMEAQGYNAALNEGNRGASFERAAAIGTAGNYGRARQQADQALFAQQRQSRQNMKSIARQHYGADLQAYAQSAIMPYLKRQVNPINPGPGPRRSFNSGMQIANRLGGAAMSTVGMLL